MLAGPHLIPTNPTHALVCLHGFGDEGRSYLNFHGPLQANLPAINLALFCPDGPQPTPFGDGRQWFSDASWTFRDPTGITNTHHLLVNYLEHIHTTHNLAYPNIALLGFSQGGMQALHSIPRLAHPLGGFICHSSRMPDIPQVTQPPEAITYTPTLFLHGTSDDIVPADESLKAADKFTSWGFATETHLIPHLAHGFNAQSLAYMSVFLNDVWGC